MLRFYNLKRILSSFILLFTFFGIEMSAFSRSYPSLFVVSNFGNDLLRELSNLPVHGLNTNLRRNTRGEQDGVMTLVIPESGNAIQIVQQFFSERSAIFDASDMMSARRWTLIVNIASSPNVGLFRCILQRLNLGYTNRDFFTCPSVILLVSQNVFTIAEQEFNQFLQVHQSAISDLGITFHLQSF